MKRITHVLIILLAILISLVICAPTTHSERSEENFDIYMDIPSEHRIKIINYGHGSIFFNNTEKYSDDVITCKRFSDVKFTIVPDYNYEVDNINFRTQDVTSSLKSNTLTFHNITEGGLLILKFKAKSSPTSAISPYDVIFCINNISSDTCNKIKKVADDFSDSVATGDNNIYIILSILVLFAFYITYITYKSIKK